MKRIFFAFTIHEENSLFRCFIVFLLIAIISSSGTYLIVLLKENWRGSALLRTNSYNRVTRLGEVLHFGRLFTLGSSLENTDVAQMFGLLFSAVPMLY
jgi:hypothetical protein